MNSDDVVVLSIAPWHIDLYDMLKSSPSLSSALRKVADVDADLAHYHEVGDTAAAVGATKRLRAALTQVAVIDATDRRALRRKVAAMTGRDALWDELPIGRVLVATALATDMDALGLKLEERTRIADLMLRR